MLGQGSTYKGVMIVWFISGFVRMVKRICFKHVIKYWWELLFMKIEHED